MRTLAYDINYPSKPAVDVKCDSAETRKYIRISEKYYFIERSKVNWFEAAHTCRRFGGDLALIESADEMNNISKYLASQDINGWFWISGNDLITNHQFMSLANGLPLSFTSWSVGQPDYPGVEHCVHLWFRDSAFRMNNWVCTEKANFLCQRQNYTRCRDSW
ncbi:C-type lectin 37Db-like [Drosophila montana]|uniref:C-type lectin 37Db-like n=1 Tax=Drosophila montana TaxID=40370 RepID=UPI00313EAA40